MDTPRAILIIDPLENGQELLTRLSAHRCILYRSPGDGSASHTLETETVDAVVVSHQPPSLDGLELVAKLRAKCEAVPIVFTAEAPTNDLIISAFRAGATDFVPRPFQASELLDRIESAIQRRTAANECARAGIQVYCLGELRVLVNGQAVTRWPSRKGRAIFTYLAHQRHRQAHRDVLLETFWPRVTPDSARDSLNVAIHGVRRLLREIDPSRDHILLRDEIYRINPGIPLSVDVEEFRNCWKGARQIERTQGARAALEGYRRAAALYHGDFLEDSRYESWTFSEREGLRESYLDVLDRMSLCHISAGETEAAIGICEEILERDSCREDVHRRLMECYRHMGRRDRALKQFRKCAEALKSELEASPTPATLDLYQQIKRVPVSDEGRRKNSAGINALLSAS